MPRSASASQTAPVSCAAAIGHEVLGGASENVVAAIQAFAAGAILTMLADTMMPEAFESAHDFTGLVTVVGFLAAFVLTKLAG
jgi:ZIP family zinc transporter